MAEPQIIVRVNLDTADVAHNMTQLMRRVLADQGMSERQQLAASLLALKGDKQALKAYVAAQELIWSTFWCLTCHLTQHDQACLFRVFKMHLEIAKPIMH